MKFLSTIREFTSLLFNKSNGNDIEVRPELTAGDGTANQEIIIPDLTDGTSGSPTSDTIVLLDHTQTMSNKAFSDKVEILGTVSGSYTITPQDSDGNKTLKLPDTPTNNDEFILNTTTQTLSNKTLIEPTLGNGAAAYPLDIIGAGSETITIPDLAADDTFVFEDHIQTLENKTIVATDNTISAITNANLAATGIANIALNKLAAMTANRATKTDASGFIIPSDVTDTELEYLDGVTSSIQTQIDTKQADVITNRGDIVVGNASNVASRISIGPPGTVFSSDGIDVSWDAPAGTGDVTAASNLTDNALVRGNGGAKGIQDSGILIDDSDNITGVVGLTASATVQGGTVTDGTATINSGDISGLGWVTYDTLIDSNKTFTTGTSSFHPGPTIDTGITITINSGATLVTGSGIVNGTIINNGTHRVL